MKKINLSQFRTRTRQTVEILTARQNVISLNIEAVEKLFPHGININPEQCFWIEMGQDENEQLHIRPCHTEEEGSAMFKPKKSSTGKISEWISHGKGVSDFIKGLAKSDGKTVPCKVQIQAVNEDGWYPVITSYWKTKN